MDETKNDRRNNGQETAQETKKTGYLEDCTADLEHFFERFNVNPRSIQWISTGREIRSLLSLILNNAYFGAKKRILGWLPSKFVYWDL
jgi:hypothetical protein